MSSPQHSLEQQVQLLHQENQALRDQLARIEQQSETVKQARKRLLKGGFRVLLPLLDRQKVARNFAKLATTASNFAGPMSRWPVKEQVLADTRDFLESCVRFVIRRRLFLLLFSILAATVPAIQLWLVFQQNEIIENQNDFFKLQVYDIVSRSMTDDNPNARLMSGALLANAELDFLRDVVKEAFDPGLLVVYRAEGVNATKRRLEDAIFRGDLIHAVMRGVEQRGRKGSIDTGDLYHLSQPMFQQILVDTADRLPQVLRMGRHSEAIDDARAEQVDYYLVQVGELLRVYSRLARAVGKESTFFKDTGPLLQRVASQRDLDQSRFGPVYRAVMQDFLFDLAVNPALDAPPVDLHAKGITPEAALQQGLSRLRKGLGEDALNWGLFEEQVKL